MGRRCQVARMGNAVAEVNAAGVEGDDHRNVPGIFDGSPI